MSLRRKLMIVLLLTAVLPMLAVRAVQAVSIFRLQNQVADDMRERLNREAEQDMLRTVDGYAHSLDQVGRLGHALLKIQAGEVEQRLVGPPPRERIDVPSVEAFSQNEQAGDGPWKVEPSERHAMVTDTGELQPLSISYDTQVVYRFDDELDDDAARDVLARLGGMTRVYRELHDTVDDIILWQYTTLGMGLHFSYPGKSAFPVGYKPVEKDWYERASQSQQAISSRPYIDASTGQLVITFAQPVMGKGRSLLGVTAIDLRVSRLLDPAALNTDWADQAKVIVVASYPALEVERRRQRPNRNNPRPERPRRDGVDRPTDVVSDTSFPADVYIAADIRQQRKAGKDMPDNPTVAFDSEEDRNLVTQDLLNGMHGVRRATIDGQDRMIAYGQIGSDEGRPVFAMIIAPTETIQKPAERAIAVINEDLTASLVNTGGILILLLLGVIVMAYVLSFQLTRPIVELANASHRVAEGDLDARVTVNRRDELGKLGEAFNEMVPALHDRMKIRESLAVAMQVQQSLLPAKAPELPGLDIAGHSEYCDETGGDYYDFIELDQLGPDMVAIAVGDVTGHGIAAALLMATGRALIRSHANTTGSLGEVFTQVNKQLCDSEFTGRFMTLMYLIVQNPSAAGGPVTARFLSAGHDPVIVYRPSDDSFLELEGRDIPLGIDADWAYKEENSDALRPGDVLVVGTDGIWECFNPQDEQFGKDRMRDVIRSASVGSAESIAQAVSTACKQWRGPREQNDDITLVVIKLI